ncbi:MAG: proline dehydrogenase family protein [Anaerolineales bacterium]
MLRALLIYLSQAEWAQNIVRQWGIARRMAARFVAGEDMDSALQAVKKLNEKGLNVTFDHLGEHVSTREGAVEAKDEILEILDRIGAEGLRSGVSIKLTQIGLGSDRELCLFHLEQILKRAEAHRNFIRIDMEESDFTDATLDSYHEMVNRGYKDVVGIVLQSYLYRTEDDLRDILERKGRVRLCKGAYKEPADVAFPKKADVDRNFDTCTRLMLDCSLENRSRLSEDGRIPPIPAIGTHDEDRIDFAKEYAEEIGLPKDGLEFQMLYGIRGDIQTQLVEEGYPVRIYVPYGTEWYPYFVRRLAERPANLWFFLSNLIRG